MPSEGIEKTDRKSPKINDGDNDETVEII